MSKYDRVIDILINETAIQSLKAGSDGQKISFFMDLDIIELIEKKAKSTREEIYITLGRNKYARTTLLDEGFENKCPNCGATVDIAHENTCSYCHTGLNRDALFWRIDNISKGQRPKYISNQKRGLRDLEE